MYTVSRPKSISVWPHCAVSRQKTRRSLATSARTSDGRIPRQPRTASIQSRGRSSRLSFAMARRRSSTRWNHSHRANMLPRLCTTLDAS